MRRSTPFLIVLCLLAPAFGAWAAGPSALLALMVDLPGWEAEPADGADVSASGMRAVTAFRTYQDGDRKFEANVLFGTQASAAWMPDYRNGYKMETPEGVMEVRQVNGFLVFEMFESQGQSGGIIVLLREAPAGEAGAVFAVSYEGLSREEAMKTAQRFSWQKMKAEVMRLK